MIPHLNRSYSTTRLIWMYIFYVWSQFDKNVPPSLEALNNNHLLFFFFCRFNCLNYFAMEFFNADELNFLFVSFKKKIILLSDALQHSIVWLVVIILFLDLVELHGVQIPFAFISWCEICTPEPIRVAQFGIVMRACAHTDGNYYHYSVKPHEKWKRLTEHREKPKTKNKRPDKWWWRQTECW